MIIALIQLLQSMVDDPEMSIEKATAKAKTSLTLVDELARLYQFARMESTCPICRGELGCQPNCILEKEYPANFSRIEAVRRILTKSENHGTRT